MVGGKPVTEIEVREASLGDSLEAEKEANPALQPTAFQVALACQVLVRAGDDTGPFVPAQFKTLKGKQWAVFREAMQEAEKLGKTDARPRGRCCRSCSWHPGWVGAGPRSWRFPWRKRSFM